MNVFEDAASSPSEYNGACVHCVAAGNFLGISFSRFVLFHLELILRAAG